MVITLLVAFCNKRRLLPKSRPEMTSVKLRPEMASEGTRCHSLSTSMLCCWYLTNPPTNQQICRSLQEALGAMKFYLDNDNSCVLVPRCQRVRSQANIFFFINYHLTFLGIPNHSFRRLSVIFRESSRIAVPGIQ